MPRFRAERAKRKINPLIEQGHRVMVAYTNTRAFEDRKIERTYGKYGEKSYQSTVSRAPTANFLEWLKEIAGPRDVLWTTEKVTDGINIYFMMPNHAMMAKLTWGGK